MINLEETELDKLEHYAVDILNLTGSFKRMTDKRLQEKFVCTDQVHDAQIENMEVQGEVKPGHNHSEEHEHNCSKT